MAQKAGHPLAGEPLEDVAFVGEERRDDFEPRIAARRRHSPQAREVPGPDLLRPPGPAETLSGKDRVGPRQVGRWAAGPGVARTKGMVGQLTGPVLYLDP